MLIDRSQITIPSGPDAPSSASIGSLFYNTSLEALQIFTGEAWESTVLDARLSELLKVQNSNLEAQNDQLHDLADRSKSIQSQLDTVQAEQDAQYEANENLLSLVNATINDNLKAALDLHTADLVLHMPAPVRAFLSEIDLDEVNGNTINTIPTIELNLASLGTQVSEHVADQSLHITAAQRLLLDGLSPELTAQELNALSGVSSPVQRQLHALEEAKLNQDGSCPMRGSLTMGGHQIKEVGKPVHETDAVNRAYVDALALGLRWKGSVRAASTSEIKLSGLQTIDDVQLVARNRVLVKDQENPAENGVYVVASGAWSRAPDANTPEKLSNMAVFIERGSVNGASSWIQIDQQQSFPGDSVQFTQFAAGSATIDDQILGTIYGIIKELRSEIAVLKTELGKKS